MRNFKDYEIWHLAMEIVTEVYLATKALPDKEKYGLQSQMRRCAVSMPSNIAEGCSRRTDKSFAQFLEYSIGSSFELQTQLLLSVNVGFLQEEDMEELLEKIDKFQRKTNALMTKMIR